MPSSSSQYYEESIVATLEDEGLDGVICGHIHHAEIKDMDGFLYLNTGDFVETCSAIVEHQDGRLELIRWQKRDPVPDLSPVLVGDLP